MFRKLSIKQKLLLVIMAISTSGILLAAASLLFYDQHAAREAIIVEYQSVLEIIAHRSSAAVAFRDKNGAQQNLEALAQNKLVAVACIYDRQKRVFAGFPEDWLCPEEKPVIAEAIDGNFLQTEKTIYRGKAELGTVYAKISLSGLKARSIQLGWVTLITVIVVLAFVYCFASVLQKLISKPILSLSEVSRRVSQDNDYSIRAEHNGEDELGVLVTSFNHMMSRIQDTQEELRGLAYKDGLTNLPNRRALVRDAEHIIQGVKESDEIIALCLIDLDGFKAVNDQIGHDAGDHVLVEVSHRMRTLLRQADLVARLGGDEFTVLLRDLKSPDDAERVAQKICDVVDQPIPFAEHTAKVSASIGISLVPLDGYDLHDLLMKADSAMYEAKQAGKNGFVFSNAQLRLEREAQVDQSTLFNSDDITYRIEPMVSIKNRSVMGGELAMFHVVGGEGMVPLKKEEIETEQQEKVTALFTQIWQRLEQALESQFSQQQLQGLMLSYAVPNEMNDISGFVAALPALESLCERLNILFMLTVNTPQLIKLEAVGFREKSSKVLLSHVVDPSVAFDETLLKAPVIA